MKLAESFDSEVECRSVSWCVLTGTRLVFTNTISEMSREQLSFGPQQLQVEIISLPLVVFDSFNLASAVGAE